MTNNSTGYGPGTPPPAGSGPAAGQPGPASGDGFFGAIRKVGITRGQDRWIGGVASGLAARFGMDPLLVRGLLGLSVLLGFGLVLYGVAWALLPEPDGRIHLEQAIRGDWDGGLIGAGVLVLIGLTNGGWWFGWGPFDNGWFPAVAWTAALIALIIIAANTRRRPPMEGQASMTDPTAPAPSPATAPPPPRPATGAPAGSGSAAPGPVPPYGTSPYGTTPTGAAGYGTAPYGANPHATARGPVPYGAATPGGAAPGAGFAPPPSAAPSWQQPHPGGPAAQQPPRPPKPPKPAKAPKPRVPGPGSAVTGAVVGVILIGLAALLIADRTGHYDGPVASMIVGAGIVLVGLAIILCGILGRRSGGLTALAIIGFVIVGPAVATDHDGEWHFDRDGASVVIGDRSYDVTSRAEAERGFTLGLGNTVIDLTDVRLDEDETLVVPVQTGMGEVTIIVPDDIPMSAVVRSGGGTVYWNVDDDQQVRSGFGNQTTFTSDQLTGDITNQLELRVDLGLGNVTIEED